jgi:hypothetical protein
MDGLEIPVASRAKRGERTVAVPVHTALKAALYLEGILRVRVAMGSESRSTNVLAN